MQRIRRKDPLFREVLLECDREIRRRLGWSVDDFLRRDPKTIGRDFSEEHFEPILTAAQIAQVECWRRRGACRCPGAPIRSGRPGCLGLNQ